MALMVWVYSLPFHLRVLIKFFKGSVGPQIVVVSVENFLYEVNEDIWIDLSCLVLSDPLRKIQLQSFSQPTNIPTATVEKLRAGTPVNYPKQWSGFAVTIGEMSSGLNSTEV